MQSEDRLQGKKIAILVANGFEQSEFEQPLAELRQAGADVEIVSPEELKVKAWRHTDWGDEFSVDVSLSEAEADDYDALVLPGGVMNPDKLRMNPEAVRFVKSFFAGQFQKPVAAICHGPWLLIEAGVVQGRRMTSFPSIKTDLVNAGALWEDEEVITDKGLITSRSPADLEAFCKKIVEEVAEGDHHGFGRVDMEDETPRPIM